MRKTPSRCIRISVLARSVFRRVSSMMMENNLSKGYVSFSGIQINKKFSCLIVIQLLNRNPKHRLGAQRDAAELKEHTFFKNIDWHALSLKQVTPPFKPIVESDESTNNFDPEFTSADIRDVGVEDMDLDDDDPSAAWVSQSIGGSGFTHTPNGPLGSERPKSTGPLSPITNGSTFSNLAITPTSSSRPQGIQIKRQKNKGFASSPLTNSVQENFRGFTYSGGESLITPMLTALGKREKDDEAVDDEEFHEITTEDEAEDTGRSAGRYANARRQNGFHDDDMS
jgi:serine/threonine protein kinase SCH9